MYIDVLFINIEVKGLFHAKSLGVELNYYLGVFGVPYEETVVTGR